MKLHLELVSLVAMQPVHLPAPTSLALLQDRDLLLSAVYLLDHIGNK